MSRYNAKKVSNIIAEEFVKKYNLSDIDYEKSSSLGLYEDDKLVSLAVFGVPREKENKGKYVIEITAFRSLPGRSVSNDLILLFEAFTEDRKPFDMFAYADTLSTHVSIPESWNSVDVLGKKAFEWVNSDVTHYTYKIAASDSDKYYQGVSHVKIGNATIEDCLNDGYYGSGAGQFQFWKKKHLNSLSKEITGIFKRRVEAYSAERDAIGDSYKTDVNCLNTTSGGSLNADMFNVFSDQTCEIHGATKFRGDKCDTCISDEYVTTKFCETHGDTRFNGGTCYKCTTSVISEQVCDTHGLTKFRGKSCVSCVNSSVVTINFCELHGEAKFRANKCYTCQSEATNREKICDVHGKTAFSGNSCLKCSHNVKMGICEIHGETKHRNGHCFNCFTLKSIVKANCETHGESNHRGGECMTCISQSFVSTYTCNIHGETTFQYGRCSSCSSLAKMNMQECEIHGLTSHAGGTCSTCTSHKSISMKKCPLHGTTKHQGEHCNKCVRRANNPRTDVNDSMDTFVDLYANAFSSGCYLAHIAKEMGVATDWVMACLKRAENYDYEELRLRSMESRTTAKELGYKIPDYSKQLAKTLPLPIYVESARCFVLIEE